MQKKEISVCGKRFVPYLSEETIAQAVTAVAQRINRDYAGREPVFVSALNGAFMFTSDLLKQIEPENIVSFIKVASYEGDCSTGNLCELVGLNIDVEGRDVVVVEDIVDSGLTINCLCRKLAERKPRSVAVACLIFKENAYRGGVKIDYPGFVMPKNDFIVGYGLDYNQRGRGLSCIYIAEE